MKSKDLKSLDGVVLEALPATTFKVKINEDGREVLAYLSGKMRMNHIRVLPGDRVVVEFTPYDDSKGRISRRF